VERLSSITGLVLTQQKEWGEILTSLQAGSDQVKSLIINYNIANMR